MIVTNGRVANMTYMYGDYADDIGGDEENVQLISLNDSKWSIRGLQRSMVQDDRGAS